MKMRARDLQEHGVYASGDRPFLRRILALSDEQVTYHEYYLRGETVQRTGTDSRCRVSAFAGWATRRLGPAEELALRERAAGDW